MSLLPGTLRFGVFQVTSAWPGAYSLMRISDGANGCANAVDTQDKITTRPQVRIAGSRHESA